MRLKKEIFLVGLVFLTFCLVGNAAAENLAGGVSLSPNMGRFWFDSDYNLQNNTQIGVAISSNITKNWSVEAGVNYIDSSATETVLGEKENVNVYFYHVDGLYHFMPDSQFVPYVVSGLGGLAFDRSGVGTDNDYLFNYGVGVKIFLVSGVALRADLRHVVSWEDITHPNTTYNSYIGSLGVSYQFGRGK